MDHCLSTLGRNYFNRCRRHTHRRRTIEANLTGAVHRKMDCRWKVVFLTAARGEIRYEQSRGLRTEADEMLPQLPSGLVVTSGAAKKHMSFTVDSRTLLVWISCSFLWARTRRY